MRSARLSVLVVCFVVLIVVSLRPIATRGQVAPRPAPARLLNPAAVKQATTISRAVGQTMSTKVVAASVPQPAKQQVVGAKPSSQSELADIDYRPAPPKLAAATFPAPERHYIAGQLWEVGYTELGHTYHTFQCKQLKQTSRNQIFGFPTWREAMVAGYQPDIDCTPSPLREVIARLREDRKTLTKAGHAASEMSDVWLIFITTETGATSVEPKTLDRIFARMIGRPVNIDKPLTDVLKQIKEQLAQVQMQPQGGGGGGIGGGGIGGVSICYYCKGTGIRFPSFGQSVVNALTLGLFDLGQPKLCPVCGGRGFLIF